MEQQTDSKSGKEYVKTVYCHSVCLTYMQSTSWETLDWKKHKLESIAGRNINNLRYADDTTLMAESEEELKSLLTQAGGLSAAGPPGKPQKRFLNIKSQGVSRVK